MTPPRIQLHQPPTGLGATCRHILETLPSWFGIPEANAHYAEAVEDKPTFLAYTQDEGETPQGFLTLHQHSPYAAEIYVMAVLPSQHGRGLGRALVEAAQAHLRGVGLEYLQVKTLAATHPDLGYAKTRAFYQKLGFRPLEVFPELWGADNPCLLLVKAL